MMRWRGWHFFLLTAAIAAGSMWLALRSFSDTNQIVWIWPETAVQLSLLTPVRTVPTLRRWGLVGGWLGTVSAILLLRLPPWFAFAVAGNTALEVLFASRLLGAGVAGFEDLKARHQLSRLAAVAVAAPVAGLPMLSVAACHLLHRPFLHFAPLSFFSDSIGIGALFPLLLFLLTGKYRNPRRLLPHLPPGVAPALLLSLALAGIFSQNTYPLLFLTFPPLILLVMTMGLEGALFANLLITLVACFATAHGHGPLWIHHDSHWERHVLNLQVYLWFTVATGLPVGALLDEHRRSEVKANDARAIYLTLLENTSEMIILSSFDAKQRFITPACERLTGWTPQEFARLDRNLTYHPDDGEVMGMFMRSMLEGKRDHRFRYRIQHKQGHWCWVEATTRAYFGPLGEVRGYVSTIRDISELLEREQQREQERQRLKERQEELHELASTDALTGLANRRAFDEALAECREGSLLMIDIDHFKKYNDRYGHQAGDQALCSVARAIQGSFMRPGDLASRWGGEEFSVLLPTAGVAAAERIAGSILASVRALALEHAGSPFGIATVSIGVATRRGGFEDASLWIQRADKALYTSKTAGRNRFTIDLPPAQQIASRHPAQAPLLAEGSSSLVLTEVELAPPANPAAPAL